MAPSFRETGWAPAAARARLRLHVATSPRSGTVEPLEEIAKAPAPRPAPGRPPPARVVSGVRRIVRSGKEELGDDDEDHAASASPPETRSTSRSPIHPKAASRPANWCEPRPGRPAHSEHERCHGTRCAPGPPIAGRPCARRKMSRMVSTCSRASCPNMLERGQSRAHHVRKNALPALHARLKRWLAVIGPSPGLREAEQPRPGIGPVNSSTRVVGGIDDLRITRPGPAAAGRPPASGPVRPWNDVPRKARLPGRPKPVGQHACLSLAPLPSLPSVTGPGRPERERVRPVRFPTRVVFSTAGSSLNPGRCDPVYPAPVAGPSRNPRPPLMNPPGRRFAASVPARTVASDRVNILLKKTLATMGPRS